MSAATAAAQSSATPEHRRRAEGMTAQPAERQSDDGLGDEGAHRQLGLSGLAHAPRDPTPHEPHGEVVPVRAPKRLHESCVLAAVGTDAVMEGDHQRDLALPPRAADLPQVAPRLLDRRLDVVQAVEDAKVVEGRGDRDLVVAIRTQGRDRAGEAVDPVRMVAVALEGRRVAAGVSSPRVKDLVDQGWRTSAATASSRYVNRSTSRNPPVAVTLSPCMKGTGNGCARC